MSKISETIREKMKDPKYRKAWIEKSKKGAKTTKDRYKFTREDQIKGGKACKKRNPPDRKHYYKIEKETLQKIKPNFDALFNPKVCDGIAFKDGKVIFIEIKCGRGYLNKNQRKFRDLISKISDIEYELIHVNQLRQTAKQGET